jgi:hypothetical protein
MAVGAGLAAAAAAVDRIGVSNVSSRRSGESKGVAPTAAATIAGQGEGVRLAEPEDVQATSRSSAEPAEETSPAVSSVSKLSDLWRPRFDPETLRMFTEVLDPVTRQAIYRVPPIEISEKAELEGEYLTRQDRRRYHLPMFA